ncbi:MAG: CBS domain-containing protein [Gammaproteobacteria bacterium]
MTAGEYCNREVVVAEKGESIRSAVNLMRQHHVGDVVVLDAAANKPVGILTDRDIVIEVLAEDVDLDALSIGDVMSFAPVSVSEETRLLDAIKLMRVKGVRRLLVVNQQGGLVGIISVEDILELIGEQLSDLVALVSREISNEVHKRH